MILQSSWLHLLLLPWPCSSPCGLVYQIYDTESNGRTRLCRAAAWAGPDKARCVVFDKTPRGDLYFVTLLYTRISHWDSLLSIPAAAVVVVQGWWAMNCNNSSSPVLYTTSAHHPFPLYNVCLANSLVGVFQFTNRHLVYCHVLYAWTGIG